MSIHYNLRHNTEQWVVSHAVKPCVDQTFVINISTNIIIITENKLLKITQPEKNFHIGVANRKQDTFSRCTNALTPLEDIRNVRIWRCYSLWQQCLYGGEPTITRNKQQPWLRRWWRILKTQIGYCSSTNNVRRFRSLDFNIDLTSISMLTRHSIEAGNTTEKMKLHSWWNHVTDLSSFELPAFKCYGYRMIACSLNLENVAWQTFSWTKCLLWSSNIDCWSVGLDECLGLSNMATVSTKVLLGSV